MSIKQKVKSVPALHKLGRSPGALFRREERKQYQKWQKEHYPDSGLIKEQTLKAQKFLYRPLLSIVVPVYDPPLNFFSEMVESVKAQSYDNWELILVDDASPNDEVREVMQSLASQEKRIKTKHLKNNLHISGATNKGIEMAKGEFVCLLDHDDILWPNALYEVVSPLNDKPYDFIYTDEDKVTEDRNDHRDPFFKPDWNQDFLYSVNYITHFSVIRKSVLDKVGYEKDAYNGAQDWELFLRVTRSIKPENIFHVPKILYSWRSHSNSTAQNIGVKPYIVEAQKSAVESDLSAKGLSNFVVKQDEKFPSQWRLTSKTNNNPLVSIIVKQDGKKLQGHIVAHTDYKNYEIVHWKKGVSLSDALSSARGSYLAIINSKVTINDSFWIQAMLTDAERPDIGMVLARTNFNSMMLHVQDLLGPKLSKAVSGMRRYGLSMHLYRTTRYNIPRVYKGVVMLDSKKAHDAIQKETQDISELSELMSRAGYRHLYNPYINVKVLK